MYKQSKQFKSRAWTFLTSELASELDVILQSAFFKSAVGCLGEDSYTFPPVTLRDGGVDDIRNAPRDLYHQEVYDYIILVYPRLAAVLNVTILAESLGMTRATAQGSSAAGPVQLTQTYGIDSLHESDRYSELIRTANIKPFNLSQDMIDVDDSDAYGSHVLQYWKHVLLLISDNLKNPKTRKHVANAPGLYFYFLWWAGAGSGSKIIEWWENEPFPKLYPLQESYNNYDVFRKVIRNIHRSVDFEIDRLIASPSEAISVTRANWDLATRT